MAEITLAYTHHDIVEYFVVLKFSNSNFYTYSSEEITIHFTNKHCRHNVKLCAQQSSNIHQENLKIITFIKNIENTMNISFYSEFSQNSYSVFITKAELSFIFFAKILIDDKDSKNRVQSVVKLSMELDPKTLYQQ